MATFILYWNPYFSSYKIDRFLEDFGFSEGKDILTEDDEWFRFPDDFNWSVAEYKEAQEGDRFIFVKVGYEKPTGIVGVGHFISDPYKDEDWSGQGRSIYYMDMEWDTVINPTSDKILKTSVLEQAIPEIVWTKGKAGVKIDPDVAEKIYELWDKHLAEVL